ncbi:MAG: hypothetical protein M0R77_03025 [Gammaproteobacteria bacterium]|nr:hypothetical protein [Gammaproteobacteria bacterium]
MRIIGGKDYYDSAIAYGIDPGIVFVRDSRKLTNGQMDRIGRYSGISVSLTHKDDVGKTPYYGSKRRVSTSMYDSYKQIDGIYYKLVDHTVIFCGKLYQGLEIQEYESMKASTSTYFWSFEKLKKWAEPKNLVPGTATPYWNRANDNRDPFNVVELKKDIINALIDNNISIAMKAGPGDSSVSRGRTGWSEADSGWIADFAGLSQIGFQSALDPYTAFQELSMWVGGTLATNGPNTITITDDKVKIAKHGFDKMSFRKPKA